MSDLLGLHSHSGLERELNMRTNKVLVDARFAPMFGFEAIGTAFTRKGVKYVEIDTRAFLQKVGVFKNFSE